METNVNYTIVGAFVIALTAAIVLLVIWLSSGFNMASYTTYLVHMRESVNGLTVDSPVEYNGVNVGAVKGIKISQDDPRVVDILLSVNSTTPVTVNTRATLNAKGLTGITYIALVDDGQDHTPLQAEHGQPYPVIATAPSLFLRMDTALNKLNDSIHQVSVSLQALLDQQNLDSIRAILDNLEKVSAQLAPMAQSANSAMRILNLQTLPAANQAMINLDQAARNTVDVSDELKRNPAVLIRGTEPPPLGPGE